MNEGKSKYIATRTVLGKPGESYSFSYGTVTFLDDGCFDIYGNVTLSVETLVNNKEAGSSNDYELRINGDDGADGADGKEGKDGGDGGDGAATKVLLKIGKLDGHFHVITVNGKGGDGGNGCDGQDGGDGGDAAVVHGMSAGERLPQGGAGGDGSDGKGRGGNGGSEGPMPAVTIEYDEMTEASGIETSLQHSAAGKPGKGGKGGKGGRGGRNGDGITRAPDGANGQDCDDGQPGAISCVLNKPTVYKKGATT